MGPDVVLELNDTDVDVFEIAVGQPLHAVAFWQSGRAECLYLLALARRNVNETDLGIVLLDVAPGEGEVFEPSFLEKIGHPLPVCHGPAAEEPRPLVVAVDRQRE